jgi:hypothetical protein
VDVWSFGSSPDRPAFADALTRKFPGKGGFGARFGLQSESEFWFHLHYTEPKFRLSTLGESEIRGPAVEGIGRL